jgi:flap endonuclease-1
MGIRGLINLLERYCSSAFRRGPISLFSGRKIAVDATNWMYTNMDIARKRVVKKLDLMNEQLTQDALHKEWLSLAMAFITRWIKARVTLVWVFDGYDAPVEKDDTKKKRREERADRKSRIDTLYEKLHKDRESFTEVELLKKELCMYNHITKEDADAFVSFLNTLGIPHIFAIGEAEKLCSALCVQEAVSAVYSTDTDNIVYGCPVLITGFDSYNSIPTVNYIRYDKIMATIGLSREAFVDMCILCGCDYNHPIKGIGYVKAYERIAQYGSIDNIPDIDPTPLNHVRCRQLFSLKNYLELSREISSPNLRICVPTESSNGKSVYENLLAMNLYPPACSKLLDLLKDEMKEETGPLFRRKFIVED